MIKVSTIKPEILIKTSRSGGPGGQHVNKTETRVQLIYSVSQSKLISEDDKKVLLEKWENRLTSAGELIITADQSRSQLKNKEKAFKKLDRLLKIAFYKPKKRKQTQPTKASKERRLQSKKKLSEKKKWRRGI